LVNKFIKFIFGLALLLGITLPTRGQTSLTGRIVEDVAANRPTTCTTGDVYVDTDDANSWRCFPNNVWVSFGGGLVSPITAPNPLQFNVDLIFKGPNPAYDARVSGVRSVSVGSVPAIPGTTVSINAGSASAIISSSSGFQTGDGVVIYGAGVTNPISTPSSPTVTPVNAVGLTGTLLDTASPSGSTTYQYCVAAWGGPVGQAVTACSANTSISTGQASLGPQSVSITSIANSNGTFSIVTSSAHTVAVGALVQIRGALPANFNGYFRVLTAVDNTHLTVSTSYDTRNGALVAPTTAGTLTWWNSNRITVAAATGSSNGTKYLVYGRTSGSMTLLGVMWPQNSNFNTDPTYLAFDDYGPTFTVAPNLPFYISSSPPVSSTNDSLVTTIVSGLPSTTIILAATASNSVSGATILFDDGVTLAAASLAAKNEGAKLVLPAGGTYPINSPTTLANSGELDYYGGLNLNETLNISTNTVSGQYIPNGSAASFGLNPSPVINVLRGWPGLYATNNVYLHYLTISSGESANLFMQDGGTGQIPASTFDRTQWTLSGNGYTSTAQVFRTNHTNSFADIFYSGTLLTAGQLGSGSMSTPGIFWSGPGNPVMRDTFLSGKGMLLRPAVSGSTYVMDWVYSQANYMPYLSVIGVDGGGVGITGRINTVLFDTTQAPLIANLGGVILSLVTDSIPSQTLISSPNSDTSIVGPPVGSLGTNVSTISNEPTFFSVNDGTFNAGVIQANQVTPQYPINSFVPIGPAFAVFVEDLPGTAPTCSVVNSGTFFPSAGTWFFEYAYKYANGGMGTPSFPSTGCTVNGTSQDINVVLPTAPATIGLGAYIMAANAANGPYFYIGGSDPTTQGAAWNASTNTYLFSGFASIPSPTSAGSGPSGISSGLIWGKVVSIGSSTISAPNNTVPRNLTLPDTSGTVGIMTGSFTNAHCLQASVIGGVLSIADTGATCGSGGGGATFQVNGTNTSSQTTINFQSAATFNGITAAFSNPSAGNVLLTLSGAATNAFLLNSSVTINTALPLTGGGVLALGGTLNLTCPNCSSGGVNSRTTNYNLVSTDDGFLVSSNGTSLTDTLPSTPPSAFWDVDIQNLNATNLTISRNGLLINGAANNIVVPPFQSVRIFTDSANYFNPNPPLIAGTNITITGAPNGITIAASGTGVGGSGTTGFFSCWTSSSNLGNCHMDDGVTTAATITATEPIVAPSVTANGLCNAGTTGCVILTAGTAPSSFNTNSFTLYAPTSISTPYGWVVPSAAATGILHLTNAANVVTLSVSAINLAGADVTGNLPFSQLSAATNSNPGTFAVSSNTWDFSAATLIKMRTAAGLTTTVNGDIGYDTTNKNWHAFQNGVDSYQFGGPVSGTYTSGDCVEFSKVSNVITLIDAGAACGSGGGGGATLQTNSVNNTSQTTLNLINSAATNGITLTVTNTSGGTVQLGYTGTLNNSGLTNSSTTIDGVTCTLGSTCTLTLDEISNPVASKTFTFPATNVLTISGTAPASQSGAGLNAGTLFSVTGVTGSATTGSATTAGSGSFISLTCGNGGSGSGGTNAVGGQGGDCTIIAGNAGVSGGTAANARGGNIVLTSGLAGSGGSGAAGAAGIIQLNGATILATPSTSAVNNSWSFQIQGEYQNSGTPTFTTDTWTVQDIIGSGTNGTSTLTFSHLGSTGSSAVNVPLLTVGTAPACVPGTAGGECFTQGTAFTNVAGSAGFYPDSTTNEFMAATNGSSSFGMLVRSQPSPIHQTGKTAAISTATLCAASAGACNTAGEYHLHFDFIETGTACTVPGTGGVTFLLTWTDSNGTAHSAVSLGMDDASTINAVSQTFHFQTSLGAAWGSGDFNISTNGSVIQYATGYTACGTGTGTYQLDAAITRLQ
jgi:hypothetical protein